MKRIHNWHLVELTNWVLVGDMPGQNGYMTRKIMYIDPELTYLITEDNNFHLGKPDKVWINTVNIKQKVDSVNGG